MGVFSEHLDNATQSVSPPPFSSLPFAAACKPTLKPPLLYSLSRAGMDPLSAAASVIAVAGLAASTGQAFMVLRSLCKGLPGRLHALSNEVTDLEFVLHQVAAVFRERGDDPTLRDHALGMPKILQGANSKLEELKSIIQALVQTGERSKVPLHGAFAWRKDSPKLQVLQDDIKNIKCNLNLILGASNSYVTHCLSTTSPQDSSDEPIDVI